VKKRFQILPSKCNLQRYTEVFQALEKTLADSFQVRCFRADVHGKITYQHRAVGLYKLNHPVDPPPGSSPCTLNVISRFKDLISNRLVPLHGGSDHPRLRSGAGVLRARGGHRGGALHVESS
jgi:hypothetical protein